MKITHLSRAGLWLRFKSGATFAINQHGWCYARANQALTAAANFPAFWRVIDHDSPSRRA